MQFVIENENYRISISSVGASITNIYDKVNAIELEHQIDDGGWDFQDIVAFPAIGIGEYKFNGQILKNPKRHGLVRDRDFLCTKPAKNSALLTYNSSDVDFKYYPFQFSLRILYTIEKNTLFITYNVRNNSNQTMYFHIGNQIGLRVNKEAVIDLCKNNIYFPLIGDFVNVGKKEKLHDMIMVDPNLFEMLDTIVLLNKTGQVILKTNTHTFTFDMDSPLISIWTNPHNPNFVCIDPWWGVPEYRKGPLKVENCKFVNKLEPLQSAEFAFSIKIS